MRYNPTHEGFGAPRSEEERPGRLALVHVERHAAQPLNFLCEMVPRSRLGTMIPSLLVSAALLRAKAWCARPLAFAAGRPAFSRRLDLCLAAVSEQPAATMGRVGVLESEADFVHAINGTSGDDLVVVKFFAPWCRACRGLEPKYKRLSVEYAAKGGVRFYELSHKTMAAQEGGSDFLQKHEVNVLPLIHFYARGARVEAFPCGPRKIELLREKLEKWHGFAQKETNEILDVAVEAPASVVSDDTSRSPGSDDASADRAELIENVELSEAELELAWSALKRGFQWMSNEQMRGMLRGARTASYAPGDVLVAEGEVGRRFFILLGGECDVYQLGKATSENRLSGFSPDATRTAFGGRINMLAAGAFFGERALVENQPRVATIVAATSVKALSIERSALADAGVLDYISQLQTTTRWGYELANQHVSQSYANDPSRAVATAERPQRRILEPLSVMQRLRLVRIVVRAFDQAASRSPAWGDEAEKAYRRRLVDQLTDQQRFEFEQTFDLLDRNGDGAINVEELKELMRAFGRTDLSNEHLSDIMNKANPEIEGNDVLNRQDFLALLAQAEFSAMFLETFKLLDQDGHGWLEAEQLWRMLEILVGRDFHDKKLDALADKFGVDDGMIDYAAFVRILLMSPAALSVP